MPELVPPSILNYRRVHRVYYAERTRCRRQGCPDGRVVVGYVLGPAHKSSPELGPFCSDQCLFEYAMGYEG